MASPGYPPMGAPPPQMQPMPQMQMQMPPRQPVKHGTSRAVPIVVSAGLAVGVFCGLLFGLGVDKGDASAEPAKGNNVKSTTDTGSGSGSAGLTGLGATTAMPPPPKVGSGAGSATVVAKATGSGTAPASGSAGSAASAVKTLKLSIEISPEAAASGAKIVIDGKEITGNTIDLPLDKKSVKLSVTAPGFHSIDKKIDIDNDADTSVKLEMVKRGPAAPAAGSPGFGGASTGGNHVPTAPPGKKKPPPGSGIIDI